MKLCSNCSHPVNPGADTFVGVSIWPGIYVAVFNHSCGGTYGCVLHEINEDATLLDGDLRETVNGLSDLREDAA